MPGHPTLWLVTSSSLKAEDRSVENILYIGVCGGVFLAATGDFMVAPLLRRFVGEVIIALFVLVVESPEADLFVGDLPFIDCLFGGRSGTQNSSVKL